MNKFGVVLGVAAVATLAGCKDPDYKNSNTTASQNDVKVIETASVGKAIESKCQCAPGTKHTTPCNCGDADCACVVETKAVAVEKKAVAAEADTTTYIVQNGDYLAKISKKFNVTVNSIRRLNPSIKGDKIWVGQKLKLPGKLDVGEQKAPVVKAKAVGKQASKGYAPYTGATKEYVVKSGDTLGAVAYGNGINIRQLKELNALKSDSLKVGQKLKVPAEKVAAQATPKAEKVVEKKVEAAAPVQKVEEPQAVAPQAVEEKPVQEAQSEAVAPAAEQTPEAAPAPTTPAAPATAQYIVKEGEDVTSIAIGLGLQTSEIRELNNLGEGDTVSPGQVLKVPAYAAQ